MYKVIIEDPAISDLRGIHLYISETLKEPIAAQRIYLTIKSKIKTLDKNPLRCKVVDDEPYRSKGLRPLYIGNYTAFFVADESNKRVHVLRILHNRRQWQNFL